MSKLIEIPGYKKEPKFTSPIPVAHSLFEFILDVEFLKKDIIYKLGNHNSNVKNNKVRFFYRGEGQEYKSPNVASIFRYNCNESKLYHSYMNHFNFFSKIKNFAKLTDMEHYGLPTCLLDITEEPLVALYFACCNTYSLNQFGDNSIHMQLKAYYNCDDKDRYMDKKYYGVVYIISPFTKDVIYNNNYSDTAEILATFALLKNKVQQKIYDDILKFNKITFRHVGIYKLFYNSFINRNLAENYIDKTNRNVEIDRKLFILSKKNCSTLRESKYIFMKMNRLYNKFMFHSYEMINFSHKIRQDISDFEPMINLSKFFTPKIIQPVRNNKRIKAQKGLFIFENFLSYNNKFKDDLESRQCKSFIKKRMKHISNEIFTHFNIRPILIPNVCKHKILLELDSLYRINSSTLFPNLSNVASFLRNKLKP